MKNFNLEAWEDLERRCQGKIESPNELVRLLISERELIFNAISINESRFRSGALELIRLLPNCERTYFFPQLMRIASFVNGFTEDYRNIISDLPRDWVMGHIEDQVEGILKGGGYEEYRCLLEVCRQVDRDLMKKMARKAANNIDPDIREAGRDYLDM
ncbi:hypothetical protein WI78_18565 [Burkholderia ubonensis]|uniref:hypothetical protein n=1 Tax=Burkholderia ubonensis TaxID=101571 RepID=UPI00075E7D87|nr:hypothetical protein [Burkholderia ubonensis]KVC95094.1 hypothetical protein WI78_18565 [Burkholderia ubonensis]